MKTAPLDKNEKKRMTLSTRFNETLNTDLYEVRMAAGYAQSGMGDREAVFELFYRQNPFRGGFCII